MFRSRIRPTPRWLSKRLLRATVQAATASCRASRGQRDRKESPPRWRLGRRSRNWCAWLRDQGYLTYGDINDALPDSLVTSEDLDEIYIKLRNLEIDIVDQAEVDRVKQPELEEEDEKSRLDILDDPVRMYLKQMGQVPLLTREQEVEISKRIEEAEEELKLTIYSFGFTAKEHIALGEKLIADPPKERFDRVILDKKIDGRGEPSQGVTAAGEDRG